MRIVSKWIQKLRSKIDKLFKLCPAKFIYYRILQKKIFYSIFIQNDHYQAVMDLNLNKNWWQDLFLQSALPFIGFIFYQMFFVQRHSSMIQLSESNFSGEPSDPPGSVSAHRGENQTEPGRLVEEERAQHWIFRAGHQVRLD